MGLSDAREGSRLFYRHVVEVDRRAHAVARYLRMGEALGVAAPAAEDLRWDLPGGMGPEGGGELLRGGVALRHDAQHDGGRAAAGGAGGQGPGREIMIQFHRSIVAFSAVRCQGVGPTMC